MKIWKTKLKYSDYSNIVILYNEDKKIKKGESFDVMVFWEESKEEPKIQFTFHAVVNNDLMIRVLDAHSGMFNAYSYHDTIQFIVHQLESDPSFWKLINKNEEKKI